MSAAIRFCAVLALSAALALIVEVSNVDRIKDRSQYVLLTSRKAQEVQQVQSLLGFSPDLDESSIAAFGSDDDESQLPAWATTWADKAAHDGEDCTSHQCNAVGSLGLWVMKKTEPKYNPAVTDEKAKLKKCMNLPGWALNECLKMRELEFKMRKSIKKPPQA